MRKRKEGRVFGRKRNARRALVFGLAADLIERERILTTLAKAKELKRIIDPIVVVAKKSHQQPLAVPSIRRLRVLLPEKSVQKFRNPEFIQRFEGRTSGFTRIVRLEARKSDGAEIAVIEFV